MSFDDILAELTRGIPECTASGVVDVPTGMVLSCKAAQRGYRHEFELLATAAASVFAAAPYDALDGTVGPAADPALQEFKEVTLMGGGQIQVYCRPSTNPDLVLIVVCKASTNLGLILAKTRLQMAALEAQVS